MIRTITWSYDDLVKEGYKMTPEIWESLCEALHNTAVSVMTQVEGNWLEEEA